MGKIRVKVVLPCMTEVRRLTSLRSSESKDGLWWYRLVGAIAGPSPASNFG